MYVHKFNCIVLHSIQKINLFVLYSSKTKLYCTVARIEEGTNYV